VAANSAHPNLIPKPFRRDMNDLLPRGEKNETLPDARGLSEGGARSV
jgi:hypothetical protein